MFAAVVKELPMDRNLRNRPIFDRIRAGAEGQNNQSIFDERLVSRIDGCYVKKTT